MGRSMNRKMEPRGDKADLLAAGLAEDPPVPSLQEVPEGEQH